MLNEIKWTYHALTEVKHELNTDSDDYAKLFIKDSMRNATFISEIMGANGKIDRLFAYQGYCFVLDRTDDVVITVYKREKVHEEIRTIVRELLFEKLADLEETEKLLEEERLAAIMKLELNKELSKAEASTGVCNLGNVIPEAAAQADLEAIEQKLYEFRLKKSKLAKGIAAYI